MQSGCLLRRWRCWRRLQGRLRCRSSRACGQKSRRHEFANVGGGSVSRVACMGLLAASAMIALGKPADRSCFYWRPFHACGRASQCFSVLRSVFAFRMFLWSAQSIYSRAFYAAGNTFVPMAAGTMVTVVSLPIYVGLFHVLRCDGTGVRVGYRDRDADAGDCGIAAPARDGIAGEPGLSRDGAVPGWRLSREAQQPGWCSRFLVTWECARLHATGAWPDAQRCGAEHGKSAVGRVALGVLQKDRVGVAGRREKRLRLA